MCKKQEWLALAEKCDVACNKYWAARDSVECAEIYWKEYQLARKAERDAYVAYLAD